MNPDGAHPENALTGTIFVVNSYRSDTISVSSDYSKLRFWANTDIANLQPGQSIQLAPGTLGYEWDIDWDNGFRPAGLIDLSSTTVNVNTLLANLWQPRAGNHNWQRYAQSHSVSRRQRRLGVLGRDGILGAAP